LGFDISLDYLAGARVASSLSGKKHIITSDYCV
jgi:hypothetical protein